MQRAFLLAILVLGLGQAASAVEHSAVAPDSRGTFRGRPTVAAVRVVQAPDIDGYIDDDAWHLAKPAGDFLQKNPNLIHGVLISYNLSVLTCKSSDN